MLEFDVHYRPLWDWCKELLLDTLTVSQFEWDAQRLYKYSDAKKSFVRFYDEPWTADAWWEYQVSSLPIAVLPPQVLLIYAL